LLLSCSGGLDSSIVAAALAQSGAETIGLTMYGEDPSGDERPYARVLCEHLGVPLVERAYALAAIDIDEPLGRHLPRPTDRSHALAYERAHLETARSVGARAFVTGNGGDSVFGYSQSAAAAADRYLHQGLVPGLAGTLRDICIQTGCSMSEAALSALRLARRAPVYRCRPDVMFLDPDLAASLGDSMVDHPWLDAPAGALPGKAAHIASILRVQQCLEPARGRELPVINPLMSQPVIETCLAVPSWLWRTGGRDRALARSAFRNRLPAAVLGRRIKGGPDGFAAQVLEHFRAPIRERLLDGQLARERIIDRDAIERELADPRPSDGQRRARILEFVAAEAWIGSWSRRKRDVRRRRASRARA
jgi:asparagine synthase (glutamine-hydrolysing)